MPAGCGAPDRGAVPVLLTAPLFLLAAGAVLIWSGPEALTWRGSPAALAATHFVTLGFMTMVMAGAMLQMLPVLGGGAGVARGGRGGARARRACTRRGRAGRRVPAGQPLLLKIAAWLLGAGIALLAVAAAAALTRAAVRNATTRGMSLGIAGTRGHGRARARPRRDVRVGRTARKPRRARVAPGVGTLRVGRPARGRGGVPGGADVPDDAEVSGRDDALVHRRRVRRAGRLVAGGVVRAGSPVELVLGLALAAGYALFAVTTLAAAAPAAPPRGGRDDRVLAARNGLRARGVRRLGGAACYAGRAASLEVAIGVLALAGFAVSVIDGMLYKIVPFLAWFHLQAAVGAKRAPHMKRILGDAPQHVHLALHAGAVALLLIAVAWPEPLARVAGLALALSAAMLLRNLSWPRGGTAPTRRGDRTPTSRRRGCGSRSLPPLGRAGHKQYRPGIPGDRS